MKNYRPKTLSLQEMWELYKLLEQGTRKEYLLDEIVRLLETIPPSNIKKSIGMMYKNMSLNPIEVGLMFTQGLQHNRFFEFQDMVNSLK